VNLIAPIAVTEELDADDCETESEANEEESKPIAKSKNKICNNSQTPLSKGSKATIGSPELSKKDPKIKECQNAINFSSSTPAKLNNPNGKRFSISRLKFPKKYGRG
jgi:hypothetical protein